MIRSLSLPPISFLKLIVCFDAMLASVRCCYSVSRLNEVQIYLRKFFRSKFILLYLGVQNLFCLILECKIYFASYWNACYFAKAFRSKFILLSAQLIMTFFLNAPFAYLFDMSVLYPIGKRYIPVETRCSRLLFDVSLLYL